MLKETYIDTKLGPMIAIADEEALFLLEFADCKSLVREIEKLKSNTKLAITSGKTAPINLIEEELEQYFKTGTKKFTTPIMFFGTDFQKSVWQALRNIPNGKTKSYSEIAIKINRPKSYRAVAMANAANQLAIIVPCHRVINSNGELGGYAGGVERKQWLLKHEK